ncbi:MAG: LysR family transcriptional regulator [Acidimicrobiia bacterium]
MDLRQLGAMVAVADHSSFSAAARALHTVQSNVSTHVANLERELSVTLVDRRSGRLTEEGEAVVGRARRIQRELEALVSDMAALRDEVSGKVRIGVIGTTARWLVPRLLQTMGDGYPAVDVTVVDATTTLLLPQVASGQIDLAVLALPTDDPEVDTVVLFEEDLVLVAPDDHPLAGRSSIELRDLDGHELLLEPPGTAFRDDLDTQARAAGIELRVKAEVDGMRLVASLAFGGFGAAVLPASAAPRWLTGRWRVVPIKGVTGRTVGLARRRRALPSAATRALIRLLHEIVTGEAAEQPGICPAGAVRSVG